ncbi:MAG: hypothetical protein ACRD1G_12720 [Acidimicrobiales bacterium]
MGESATRKPRFNHVAMSVSPGLLDEKGRKDICDFYGDVFGWRELPTETLDRKRLVLQVHTIDQFVFLVSDENPMACPRLDHYGLSVTTEDALDEILAKAKAFKEQDSRVDIVDKELTDHGMLAITSIYIGYLLPMMVEIQYWKFADADADAQAKA